MAEETETQEEQPGIDLAYDLMQSSYDWAVNRLNAVESRIQALIVLSASFIVTAPALVAATGSDITLNSPWFYLALGIAAVNLAIGALTRARGEIKLLGINKIFREWLDLPPNWFKLYAVERAAEHFEANVRTVNRAGQRAIWMTVLFFAEAGALVMWGITQIG